MDSPQLEIAVNHPGIMRGGERGADLLQDPTHLLGLEDASGFQAIAQTATCRLTAG